MKEYLLWGQVQRKLTEHYAQYGATYSFFEAARSLWLSGQAQRAEELPAVSFQDWDVDDLDAFERLFYQTPVDMAIFHRDFERELSSQRASEQIIDLDIIPIMLARDQSMGAHRHDSFEVLYVMRGAARLLFGGQSRPLPTGTICIVSPHLLHDAVAEEGCQLISIAFSEQTIEDTLYKLLRQESVLSDFFRSGLGDDRGGYLILSAPDGARIRTILRNVFHECYAREEYSQSVCANYLEILFAQILRQCGGQYERHTGLADRQGAPPMLAILKHIQSNYKTTSLGETAALFHYEASYLGKQIKSYTGKNYTALVSALRINEAKRLLSTTELSVAAVAEQAGFDSLVHFSRSFRGAMGVSPTGFRRQVIGETARPMTENVK